MRAKDAILPAIVIGGAAGYAWSQLPADVLQSSDQRMQIEQSVYYPGCNDARATGKTPSDCGATRSL